MTPAKLPLLAPPKVSDCVPSATWLPATPFNAPMIHGAACGEAAAGTECQRTGVDRGAAQEGVGSGQRQRRGTVLDQATGAAHHTGQSQVVAARQGQRVGA
ncbi:hypothetical protein G6F24_015484 [Rhizopus arrhizus]|nr:hypothetical protein G6F24_015484 [Rhizopus arrhizus]